MCTETTRHDVEETFFKRTKLRDTVIRMSMLHKFLVAFLLLLCGCASNVFGEEDDIDHFEDDVPLPSGGDLDEMIAYLRHEDTRLVRYNVPR